MKPGLNVAFMRPGGNVHAEGLREVALTLEHGLRSLGADVSATTNQVRSDATNIVLGGHHLAAAALASLPPGSILYNFEQICAGSLGTLPDYQQALGRFAVWDYSRRNLDELRRLHPRGDFRHVPLGYVPELTHIEAAPVQDIDVLFYGSVNERRKRVLAELQALGVAVHAVFGVYGAQRDALIARSRLVLNVHFYPAQIFEVVRVSYLLANGKAVVSECTPQTEIDPDLRAGIEVVDCGLLARACVELLQDDPRRRALERRALACICARPEAAILAGALGVVVSSVDGP